MPLDFADRKPRPAMSSGTIVRLGSLILGLVLVFGLMRSIRSPQSVAKLSQLFGERPVVAAVEQSAAHLEAAEAVSAKVDSELLVPLDDDKPFRPAESAAWFHLLALVGEIPDDQLRQASLGPITYTQLLAQPDHYRARVVSVAGLAHRIETIDQDENEAGLKRLFRVIVQPGGVGSRSFIFYCRELPPEYELGDSPRPVRFEGFFFKNLVFGHQQGLDKSPVILGRSFEPLDAAPPGNSPNGLSTPWMIGIAIAVVLLMGFLLRQALVPPRPMPRRRASTADDDPASVAAALEQLETAPDAPSTEIETP